MELVANENGTLTAGCQWRCRWHCWQAADADWQRRHRNDIVSVNGPRVGKPTRYVLRWTAVMMNTCSNMEFVMASSYKRNPSFVCKCSVICRLPTAVRKWWIGSIAGEMMCCCVDGCRKSMCLSVCLSVCMYVCLSAGVCVCLSACLCVSLSVCMYVYLCLCLWLSACLSVSVCKVDVLTSENSQLKERVALLEKLLNMNKQDGQLLSKMVNVVCHCHCQVSLSLSLVSVMQPCVLVM